MTFDIALTGINAAGAELETISNNIANGQTTGFKRADVEFADVYATSTLGGARFATGQGVEVAEIRNDFRQGDLSFTDNNLDLAVEGQGWFRLSDNGQETYSRAGALGLDREGYIVNAAGHRLLGKTVDEVNRIQPVDGELRVDFADLQPRPTENVELSMNLRSDAEVLPPFDAADPGTYNYSTSTTVYDSLGTAQVASLYLRKDAANSWSSYLFVDGVEVGQPGGDELGFDASGALATVNGAAATSFTSTTYSPVSGAGPMTLEFDVGDITQYETPFGTNQVVQDGYAAGRLDDFDIDSRGVIFGRYSNGQALEMGQVTLANFSNPQGLIQKGGNTWYETFESGEPAVGEPGSASLGQVRAGALEGSNVDITQELVAMIGAQRSFQANAQVISTGDTLTQTVINIRR